MTRQILLCLKRNLSVCLFVASEAAVRLLPGWVSIHQHVGLMPGKAGNWFISRMDHVRVDAEHKIGFTAKVWENVFWSKKFFFLIFVSKTQKQEFWAMFQYFGIFGC